MSPTENADKSAGDYGREALAHWTEAIRLGARALSERKQVAGGGGLKERLREALPSAEENGDGEPEASEEHLFDDGAPMPIQESIDVAVPVAAVFDLCTRFEELDRFSERIGRVEIEDDSHFEVAVRIGARQRTLPIEIVGEEPEERLDWEAAEGFAHAGVVSFHPLAPRLTRLELTIEPQSETTVERLLRLAGIPERAIRQELRRFKAYAELWDEANDYRSADFKDPGTEAADEEAAEEEEPEEPDESEASEESEEPDQVADDEEE